MKTRKIFKKSSLMPLLLALLLVFSPMESFAASSYEPNLSHPGYNSANPFTQAGYKGQCTWFVWGRSYEKLGITLGYDFYGNAKTWWTKNMQSNTFSYGQEPRGNSIAVFGGTYGHVVFVERAAYGMVWFNEANYSKPEQYDGAVELLSAKTFMSRSNFLGFIYLD